MATSLVTRIMYALQASPVISGYATGGIYDRDLRRSGSGWTPNAFDADGDIKPTVMVDDAGDVREPFSHTAHYQGLVYIWLFAGRSTKGEDQVEELARRIRHALYQWQDSETGAQLFPAGRLGMQADDQAVFDRLQLTYSGVLPLSNV